MVLTPTLQQYHETINARNRELLTHITGLVDEILQMHHNSRINEEGVINVIERIICEEVTTLHNLRMITGNMYLWTSIYRLECILNNVHELVTRRGIHSPESIEDWDHIVNHAFIVGDLRVTHRIFLDNLRFVEALSVQLNNLLKQDSVMKIVFDLLGQFNSIFSELNLKVINLGDCIGLIQFDPGYSDVMKFFDSGKEGLHFCRAIQLYIAHKGLEFNEAGYWQTHTVQNSDILREQLSYLFRDARGAPNFLERAQEQKIVKRVLKPLDASLSLTSTLLTGITGAATLVTATNAALMKYIEGNASEQNDLKIVNKVMVVSLISSMIFLALFILCIIVTCTSCISGCRHKKPDDEYPNEHTPLNDHKTP